MRAPLIGLALVVSLSACSLGGHSSSPPAVGDTCVVGTWTLASEQNVSGYTWKSAPVSVSGLAGAKLTITSAGDEKEVFDASEPLQGTVADGSILRITIRGSYDFRIKAVAGKYTETGTATQLPTTATLSGAPVNYHSSYEPGNGTYTCSGGSLTMVTAGEVQTDLWTKG